MATRQRSDIEEASQNAFVAINSECLEEGALAKKVQILRETIGQFSAEQVQSTLLAILSRHGKQLITEQALRILDVEFPNLLERLPKWSLYIAQLSAAHFLIERGYLDRATPIVLSVSCDCVGSYTGESKKLIEQLTTEQLMLWDIQGFITMLETDEEFETAMTAFCYFEDFINLANLSVVTRVDPESYCQLNNFYKGLGRDVDSRGRNWEQLKPMMRNIKTKVRG